jgi:hypothetical protein
MYCPCCVQVLKDEMAESGERSSIEENVITIGLKGLPGRPSEQQNVRDLFYAMGLVPEDTQCPLEAMLLLFESTRKARGAIVAANRHATILHIRKWMKRLIDRSLVLGSVDRPSLHVSTNACTFSQRLQTACSTGSTSTYATARCILVGHRPGLLPKPVHRAAAEVGA